MSLLELEHVSKFYGGTLRERVGLRDVSLEIDSGELVAVWGKRRSGRSTLLRIAAGVETPDEGVVRFEGSDLSARGGEMLGGGIGYCRKAFGASEGRLVLDHLIVGQIARGASPSLASRRAQLALERAGADRYASRRPGELGSGEAVRVAIARALAFEPSLLLIDEPTLGVDVLERDGILLLLHSLAKEGIAILTSTGEATGLAEARALHLSDGELHGAATRDLAAVVPLRRPA